MSRKLVPRITDADPTPPRLLDTHDIENDVQRFLESGGQIQKPEFRRDFLRTFKSKRQGVRRAWVTTPPDLRPVRKGKTNG